MKHVAVSFDMSHTVRHFAETGDNVGEVSYIYLSFIIHRRAQNTVNTVKKLSFDQFIIIIIIIIIIILFIKSLRAKALASEALEFIVNALTKLEINMHHLQGNAIPAGPLSDFLKYKTRRGEGAPAP